MQFLTYSSSIDILPPSDSGSDDLSSPPEGCAMIHISESCQAFVLLKGLVDTAVLP